MDAEQEPTASPDDHGAAFKASSADRDRTLESIHALEAALATAGPGREAEWLRQVAEGLRQLEDMVMSEREESLRSDSLLSMIARDYSRRFGSRMRQLREQHDDIVRQIASLREQVTKQSAGEGPDVADLRQRLGWLIQAIRHRRAREADLVYEAITLDLGRGPT